MGTLRYSVRGPGLFLNWAPRYCQASRANSKDGKYGLMLGLGLWNESKPLRHKKPRGASSGESWDAQEEALSRQNKGTEASSKTGKDSLVRSMLVVRTLQSGSGC